MEIEEITIHRITHDDEDYLRFGADDYYREYASSIEPYFHCTHLEEMFQEKVKELLSKLGN
jgi:hypothetical protein